MSPTHYAVDFVFSWLVSYGIIKYLLKAEPDLGAITIGAFIGVAIVALFVH